MSRSAAPKANAPLAAPARRQRLRNPTLIGALLALITLIIYLPVSRNGFVDYDDSDYVTANAHVQSGLKWENLGWAFRTGHASNWHPLTWLSHMLDCQLFDERAGAHHLVSAGFHIANTLLLFLVLRRMTAAHWASAFVAALFALHPLHVESVAWASERKDVLSTLFLLLTLWAYARYAAESTVQSPKSKVTEHATRTTEHGTRSTFHVLRFTFHGSPYFALALLFFALGLMSKPMLVTVPFILLLLDYWPLQRLRLPNLPLADGSRDEAARSTGQKAGEPIAPLRVQGFRLIIEKWPFFVLCLASSSITFLVQRAGGAVSTSLPFPARVANALVSYVRYLIKMLWPADLSVLYPHPLHWPVAVIVLSAVLLLAISAGAMFQARRHPYLLVGWLWFVGTLVPVIGLVQVGIQSMADRYTYVPMIGLFIAVTWGLEEMLPLWPRRREMLAIGATACLVGCALVTVGQIHYWLNSETLFRRTVAVTKNNYLAYNNLGYYLSRQGRVAEAIDAYRKSLAINPAYEDALNNLGYALAGQKRYLEAIPWYEAALHVRPDHIEVHNNLGNALSEIGRMEEAKEHYRYVLEKKPDHADAHNNLGIALAMEGKLDEAIGHFRQAIRFKPGYASAHSNLGNALAVQHKLKEAITEYQEALRLKPDDAQAHNNLGNALAEQGQVDEAIVQYQQALRLNADNPEAHVNLGIALLRKGQRDEAAAHFRETLRLRPDNEAARQQLERLK